MTPAQRSATLRDAEHRPGPRADALAGRLAVAGATLGVLAGLLELTVGPSIRHWVGDKPDTTRLGVTTIGTPDGRRRPRIGAAIAGLEDALVIGAIAQATGATTTAVPPTRPARAETRDGSARRVDRARAQRRPGPQAAVVRCGLATSAKCQSITAAVIEATRAGVYHAGVKPWARAPWTRADSTSSC